MKKKYHVPKKFLHSPKIKTFYGYKYRKEDAHNALKDCKSVLFAIKKMKFDKDFIKKKNIIWDKIRISVDFPTKIKEIFF